MEKRTRELVENTVFHGVRCPLGFGVLALKFIGLPLLCWIVVSMGSTAKAQTEMDVLVLYTLGVRSNYGGHDGVAAQVLNSIVSANSIFERSEVSIRLKARAIEYIKYSESQTDMGDDLDFITESSEVAALRDEVGADLVCLFRKGSVDDTAGIAWQLGNVNGRPDQAFSVVSAQAAASGYTFTHEIGHNLGGAHDRDNSEGGGLYPFSNGHRYQPEEGPQRRTVMAYAPGWISGYISNPDVIHDGVPTGVASGDESADNARGFNLIASIVEGYRDHVHVLPVADAGEIQMREDFDGDGFETFELDASQSRVENTIVSWEWTWEGGSVSGERVSAAFPIGETTVTLTITDDEGFVDEDELTIVVYELRGIEEFSAGSSHTLVLQYDGTALGFGNNTIGELGIAGSSNYLRPTDLSMSGLVAVAAGESHSLVLKFDGSVWGSGENTSGQLGDGTTHRKQTPIKIFDSGVVDISAGRGHSLFLMSNGSVWGTGSNREGQLGDGTTEDRRRPVKIIDSGVISIEAGREHSLFIKEDGSLWATGFNIENEKQTLPVEILSSGVVSVAGGWDHILIVKTDGSLWVMGRNGRDQLGTGTWDWQYAPFRVMDSGVASVAAGRYNSLVLKTDGSLWQFGDRLFGRDPNGNSNSARIPEMVVSSGVVSMTIGTEHAIFKDEEGSVWTVGKNSNGELGTGELVQLQVPAQVLVSSEAWVNKAPNANAGQDLFVLKTVSEGSTIQLDASASSDDRFIKEYIWAWTGGGARGEYVEIGLGLGEYEISLTVTDNQGIQNTDTVNVTVASPFDHNQVSITSEGFDSLLSVKNYDPDIEYTLYGSSDLLDWTEMNSESFQSDGVLFFVLDDAFPRYYKISVE